MRMGVYGSSASPTPARAYGGASRTNSGAVQQAVADAYRSVKEPSQFEDYDLHEMYHRPLESTQYSYYNASYDSNGGETGSVV
jgi:hypothetical protein